MQLNIGDTVSIHEMHLGYIVARGEVRDFETTPRGRLVAVCVDGEGTVWVPRPHLTKDR